ncbi:MAG: hypothetical protein N2255_00920, partial [Kiritimatiellae bacterium]|nr:hypothetical protein [Kiritimatiellia bacterium]
MKKKGLVTGLLTSLLFSSGVFANAPSVIPFSDNFESYLAGSSIIGYNGWEGVTNTAAIVTNLTYTFTKSTYPMHG